MDHSLKEVLKTQPVFRLVSTENFDYLANSFLFKTYITNQYVFHQGDKAKELYIVLSGKVSIESYTLSGKIIQFVHLRKGDIFGEFAILDEGVRSAGVRVLEKTELAILPKSVFNNILDSNPLVLRKLLSLLVRRLRNSNHQVESLATQLLSQRTALLLLNIHKSEGKVLNITQQQLSERLFASREKVNSKLKELEAKGAIKRGHRKIEILSSSLLEKLCS